MLHQTIVDHARLSFDPEKTFKPFAHYYRSFAEQHQNHFEQLATETTNMLAAFEVAYRLHCYKDVAHGVCAIAPFLHVGGLYSLAEKHLLWAYEAATKAMDDGWCIVQSLTYLGLIAREWSKHDQAEAFLLEGLELARKRGYSELVCDLLRNIGLVEDGRGNFAQAEACLREGLELACGLGLQKQVCRLLAGMGVQAGKRGNYVQAETCFQEGMALAQRLEYGERVFAYAHNLGWIAYERGQYDLAEAYYHDALDVAEQSDYEFARAATRVMLGRSWVKRGDMIQGHFYLEEALKLLRDTDGISRWLQIGLQGLGELAAIEENDEQAEAYHQECLELARRTGTREYLIEVGAKLAKLAIRRSNYVVAESYLQEIQPLAYESGLNSLIAEVLMAWGEFHLYHQHFDEAAHSFAEVQRIAGEDQHEWQALALYGLARVASARHDVQVARQLSNKSLALFTTMGHYQAAQVANWSKQF